MNFDESRVRELIPRVTPYDMSRIWNADEDIRSLKSLILFGLRGMSAYAYHARVLGYRDDEVNSFFVKALSALGQDLSMNELLPLVLETGQANLKCMALLDKANTESYGTPEPATVSSGLEKGPAIIVTGHDLRDLELLLEQTQGRGVNVYTHGEMLPAHGYPKLKRYPHLKGNFGSAWQNQRSEFDNVPAAFLFTTNCLMPPKTSYIDNVFTTGLVRFEGVTHIDERKDFTPVIERALALGGPEHDAITGRLTTGFGHGAVLSVAGKIIELVKSGRIKHFFLVGGCDGARPGRNYYTEFVKGAPSDNVILALAGAFNCGVNDLPLSLVLSWYEQKTVCILLTLLSLGIKNIRLGPTLPACGLFL